MYNLEIHKAVVIPGGVEEQNKTQRSTMLTFAKGAGKERHVSKLKANVSKRRNGRVRLGQG